MGPRFWIAAEALETKRPHKTINRRSSRWSPIPDGARSNNAAEGSMSQCSSVLPFRGHSICRAVDDSQISCSAGVYTSACSESGSSRNPTLDRHVCLDASMDSLASIVTSFPIKTGATVFLRIHSGENAVSLEWPGDLSCKYIAVSLFRLRASENHHPRWPCTREHCFSNKKERIGLPLLAPNTIYWQSETSTGAVNVFTSRLRLFLC
jgi:hypothetical protein